MERRKLQATGGVSLTLTLPKAWTSKWQLKSKDEVLVSENGAVLVIRPAENSRPEMFADIPVDDMAEGWIVREVIGAYIAGADKLTMHSDQMSPSQNQGIREAVQMLFGFEILEETSQKIVARNVLDDARFPVSEGTLRIFRIVRGMFDDALRSAQTGDKELAIDIQLRDFEVNKLVHAVKRQFQEIVIGKLHGDLSEVSYFRNVASQLERVGDHAVKIAELASTDRTDPVKLSKTFSAIQSRIHNLLKDGETMVRGLDKQEAHRILDNDAELEDLMYSSKRMKQSYEGALIEDSLDRLRSHLMNIAELTIDYRLTSPK